MSNTQQSMNVPPRDVVMPNVPETQTNMGTLEHTGLPIEPIWQITDVPPDFKWMAEQWKFHTTFTVNVQQQPGAIIYTTRVVQSDSNKSLTLAQWHDIPFSCSKWWNGKVSYRFTAIKPPRVTGKLLVRYRQDCFEEWKQAEPPTTGTWPKIADKKMRTILKEWDLGQSSQFEFDITGSNPIRARPTHLYEEKPQIEASTIALNDVASYRTPWITFEMGRISVEVAQTISPGGIFPDTYQIIVEKSLKDCQFMTPTDPRTDHKLTLYNTITNNE